MKHEVHFGGSSIIDPSLHRRFGMGFSRTFHGVEKPEDLRQSLLERVQNLPASVNPSELSAHQMAERSPDPLGQERVDGHPIGHLSLLDRALLRKYSIPGRPDGLQRESYLTKVQNKRDGFKFKRRGTSVDDGVCEYETNR